MNDGQNVQPIDQSVTGTAFDPNAYVEIQGGTYPNVC